MWDPGFGKVARKLADPVSLLIKPLSVSTFPLWLYSEPSDRMSVTGGIVASRSDIVLPFAFLRNSSLSFSLTEKYAKMFPMLATVVSGWGVLLLTKLPSL